MICHVGLYLDRLMQKCLTWPMLAWVDPLFLDKIHSKLSGRKLVEIPWHSIDSWVIHYARYLSWGRLCDVTLALHACICVRCLCLGMQAASHLLFTYLPPLAQISIWRQSWEKPSWTGIMSWSRPCSRCTPPTRSSCWRSRWWMLARSSPVLLGIQQRRVCMTRPQAPSCENTMCLGV